MKTKEIKILGENWKIEQRTKNTDIRLRNCDGYCDSTIKTIVIDDMKPNDNTVNDLEHYKKQVIRHEIIHAFLDESGLMCSSEWARNEEMVDWMAIQIGKIVNAMLEVGCIKIFDN